MVKYSLKEYSNSFCTCLFTIFKTFVSSHNFMSISTLIDFGTFWQFFWAAQNKYYTEPDFEILNSFKYRCLKIRILLRKIFHTIAFNRSQISRKFEGLPDDDHATTRNKFLEYSKNHLPRFYFLRNSKLVFSLSHAVNSLRKICKWS